jgi:hypothetical protein
MDDDQSSADDLKRVRIPALEETVPPIDYMVVQMPDGLFWIPSSAV